MTIALIDSGQEFWEECWGDDNHQTFWKTISPEITELVEQESPQLRPDVLDLGCGLGRNAIAFARAGFRVTAADHSLTAIANVRQWAEDERLYIRTASCDFRLNLFLGESFDIIICDNVLYHGTRSQFKKAIASVHGWLKPGGVFYLTCPTPRDGFYGKGVCLEPDTYEMEPGHIHCHSDKESLLAMLSDFRIVSLRKHEHVWHNEETITPQFSSRWRVIAERV